MEESIEENSLFASVSRHHHLHAIDSPAEYTVGSLNFGYSPAENSSPPYTAITHVNEQRPNERAHPRRRPLSVDDFRGIGQRFQVIPGPRGFNGKTVIFSVPGPEFHIQAAGPRIPSHLINPELDRDLAGNLGLNSMWNTVDPQLLKFDPAWLRTFQLPDGTLDIVERESLPHVLDLGDVLGWFRKGQPLFITAAGDFYLLSCTGTLDRLTHDQFNDLVRPWTVPPRFIANARPQQHASQSRVGPLSAFLEAQPVQVPPLTLGVEPVPAPNTPTIEDKNNNEVAHNNPWDQARDCPDDLVTANHVLRWFYQKHNVPVPDYLVSLPAAYWFNADRASIRERQWRKPLLVDLILAWEASGWRGNPRMRRQDHAKFDPYESVAVPPYVDIRKIGKVEITLWESLAYLSTFNTWRDLFHRWIKSGLRPEDIGMIISYYRQLKEDDHIWPPSRATANLSSYSVDLWGKTLKYVNERERATGDTTDFTSTAWNMPQSGRQIHQRPECDYFLLGLADGVYVDPPSEEDRGPLTKLMEVARTVPGMAEIKLSDVSTLLLHFGISPLIEKPGDGRNADVVAAERMREAAKSHRPIIKDFANRKLAATRAKAQAKREQQYAKDTEDNVDAERHWEA